MTLMGEILSSVLLVLNLRCLLDWKKLSVVYVGLEFRRWILTRAFLAYICESRRVNEVVQGLYLN